MNKRRRFKSKARRRQRVANQRMKGLQIITAKDYRELMAAHTRRLNHDTDYYDTDYYEDGSSHT